MTVTTIFGYIFLGVSVFLYIVGAIQSFIKAPQPSDGRAEGDLDLKDVMQKIKEILDALGKLGKGMQFMVMGTAAAVIGLYLLSL